MRALIIFALVGGLLHAEMVTVPEGTKIAVALASPVDTGTARVGDPVRAATTFPVAVDGKVAIPKGTYAEGSIAKVRRRGRHAGIDVHFTRLIFTNGFAVLLNGTGTAGLMASLDVPPFPDAPPAGMGESFQSCPLPPCVLPPLPAPTPPPNPGPSMGPIIGATLGGTAAMILLMVLFHHSAMGAGLYLDAGSPLEMVLAYPLSVDTARTAPPTTPGS